MKQDLVQSTGVGAGAVFDHPVINRNGDKWIIACLQEALFRRPDNPNFKRGRMVYDFDAGRVVWAVWPDDPEGAQ